MPNLTILNGGKGHNLREVFDRASKRIDECDSCLILMQKRGSDADDKTTMLWFAPDTDTLASTVYMAWSFLVNIGRLG